MDELVAALGRNLSAAEVGRLYADGATWFGSDPLGTHRGAPAIAGHFASMAASWDGVGREPLLAFETEADGGRSLVVVGAWQGRLVAPWRGLPASGRTHRVRSLEVHRLEDGRVSESTVMLDLLDLAAQCGRWSRSGAKGTGEPWPGPGRVLAGDSSSSVAAVSTWLSEVADPGDDLDVLLRARHLSRLSDGFRWHGPAAVGSFDGGAAFVAGQQHPFRRSFSRRVAGSSAPGHRRVVHGASGSFVASGSWPAMVGTHSGSAWLGLPASGRSVELRIVDVYAVGDGRIGENWVMIDMVHALEQMGVSTGFEGSAR